MLIEATAISIELSQKSLLNQLSFNIVEGDYLAIVGPNGSGKTTLLKALCGLIPLSSGQLTLNGIALSDLTPSKRARLISYVPQSSGRQMPFIVEEFVKMSRYAYHSALSEWQSEDHDALENAFEITDTNQFRKREMPTLSGGEAQRVMIAAAVCQQTPIMLLDEPSSYLDPHHQVEVHHLIRRLNQEHGMTIIEVTHDINHASLHAQTVMAIKSGRLLWSGPHDQFLDTARLSELYNQSFIFMTHPSTGLPIAIPAQ